MLNTNLVSSLSGLNAPLLTVYVNTEPGDASRHRTVPLSVTWLKQEGSRLLKKLGTSDRAKLQLELSRTEEFLTKHPWKEQGLLVLTGPSVWKAIPLPHHVDNEMNWGEPALSQLQCQMDEARSYCVMVVDRKGARFFQYSDGSIRELSRTAFKIDATQWKRKSLGRITGERGERAEASRGSQRDAYEHRKEAQYRRFFREAAQHAIQVCKDHDLKTIFVVASDRVARPIKDAIPKAYSGDVALILEDFGQLAPAKLHRRLRSAIRAWREGHEMELMKKLETEAKNTVSGIDETLYELQKRHLRMLVIARDIDSEPVRRCVKCGWTDRSADRACRICHGEREAATLRSALCEMLRKGDLPVEILGGEAAHRLMNRGGMAGWLRDRTQSQLR